LAELLVNSVPQESATMSVLTVTGAFATHTTRLYNYYVVETKDLADHRIEEVAFIAVNYLNHLQYLGRVRHHARWDFDEANGTFNLPRGHDWPEEVVVDLREFACKLLGGEHYIFLLDPIHGGGNAPKFRLMGKGPLVQRPLYISSVEELLTRYGFDR